MEIKKIQLKRVNPFQGLVIDAETWQDAHNYHRDQQRLHVLAFHDTGIVSGLEVNAVNPPDYSVNINSGLAIDPDGNVIIMPEKQRYRLKTPSEKGTIYLIIQFREILSEPYQPPQGGQPTRILEAYRIQERELLPSESYIELARLEFDPAQSSIRDAKNPAKPAANEIDLRFRKNARSGALREVPALISPSPSPSPAPIAVPPASAREIAYIGCAVLGENPGDLHLRGLKNVIKSYNRNSASNLVLEEGVNLNKSLKKYSLLYLTGSGRFELNAEILSTLKDFLNSGGLILGDGCTSTGGPVENRGAKEFGLAFNRWAGKLDCKLEMPKREHPVLNEDFIFSEAPAGCEPPILLEGGNMICCSSDYGCAWAGGRSDKPLSRENIRAAAELGSNFLSYAVRQKSGIQ
jgi:hypothetical protein